LVFDLIKQEDIYNIFSGESILFLGAGFSIENKNANGDLLPSGKSLSVELQQAANIQFPDENIGLDIASEYFIEKVGKTRLVNFLKERFTVSDCFDWQKDLLALPWKRIYTTNYDNVLELASTQSKNHRRTIAVDSRLDNVDNLENTIIHINGFIDNITEENLKNSTKLTSESYADEYLIKSSWNTELSNSFKYAKNIYFIGFSAASDLDLKRIIASQEQIRNKVYFINDNVPEIIKISLEKFGKVTNLTGESFTKQILLEKKDYIPVDSTKDLKTYSFVASRIEADNSRIRGKDITDLLISGKVDERKLFANYNRSNYVLFREKINDVISNLGKYDLVTVTSNLGNGKSIFLKILESVLIQKGYKVFTYSNISENIYSDIDVLNNLMVDNCCLILDDYYSLKSQFDLLGRLNNNKIKIIIAGRRTLHDNIINDFKRSTKIPSAKTYSINLDNLTRGEKQSLQKIIEEHNLWGELSSKTEQEKFNFINLNSTKGLGGFIVEFLKKTNILKKFKQLYLKLDYTQRELVTLLLINNILRLGLDVESILKLTDNTSISDKIKFDINLGEFLNIDKNEIEFISTMASLELFDTIENRREVVQLLSKVLKQADEIEYQNNFYYIKRIIISFSNFKLLNQNILEEELNDLALEYYETIQNYSFTKRNQFFWLQFGIQRLNAKQYDLANKYFDNALNYARENGMNDFYQINAQKARGLVEDVIENSVPVEEAFSKMKEAHNLLIKDLNNVRNKQHYQLSQGNLYYNFYSRYGKELAPLELMAFLSYVNSFRREVENYQITQEGSKVDKSLHYIKKILKEN
jgi:hypothetical protein